MEKEMSKLSQNERILAHLSIYGSITPMEALDKFGCFRLSSRINELKGMGHFIKTNMIHANGKSYAEYVLENTSQMSFV